MIAFAEGVLVGVKRVFLRLGSLLLLVASPVGPVIAGVHDGGVGACKICHSMHGPAGGGRPGGSQPGGGSLLLQAPASDLCLSCHADAYGAVLGGDPLAPPPERGPGNFVFLLANNLNDGPDGATNPIIGDAAGHNLHAPGHGLAADGTHMTSPGGTYPANNLKCTSCHDPHGNTNYRMLRGPGLQQGSGGAFTFDAPEADGLDLETGGVESEGNHVAYRSGMSNWCGNCHAAYLNDHNGSISAFAHPGSGTLDQEQRDQYIRYNGTADPVGGVAATSYLAAVPFEDAAGATTSREGPTASSRLMCLTCHRAHASSSPAAGRWDFRVGKLGEDGVISGSYAIPNPYVDPDQDPLCWKCHVGGTD